MCCEPNCPPPPPKKMLSMTIQSVALRKITLVVDNSFYTVFIYIHINYYASYIKNLPSLGDNCRQLCYRDLISVFVVICRTLVCSGVWKGSIEHRIAFAHNLLQGYPFRWISVRKRKALNRPQNIGFNSRKENLPAPSSSSKCQRAISQHWKTFSKGKHSVKNAPEIKAT